MTKALLVVESPAKAKTIRKYLGADFDVRASVGHILDLPKHRMGVDLDSGDFAAEYVPITGKSKVISELQDAARKADIIYLAPDPDREGEAIAFHIAQVIHEGEGEGKKKKKAKSSGEPPIHRIRIFEITKKAVQEALKHPDELNAKLYDAQQARRILDRVVGYQISPILWKKVRRGLSAGRVQSVAVRLVVDREREILAFITEEYWSIEAQADAGVKPIFPVKLFKIDGKKADINNHDAAFAVKTDLQQLPATVSSVQKKKRARHPGPPFITSKLQQDAARALRYSPKKTMSVAQSLYEGVELGADGAVGLITYMRTDSTRVSADALQSVREYILDTFGKSYLPETPNVYKSKKSAQEGHEAIRPTSLQFSPERVRSFLRPDQYKLYKLIWDRFVASQMAQAEFDQTQIDVDAGKYTLRATGSIMRFDGFLRAYNEQADEDDESAKEEEKEKQVVLPDVAEGASVKLSDISPLQHFTQPPPRFTEASLVKELEDKGIGRPSTYASILSTVQDKDYVNKKEGRLYPTELGCIVTDLLVESFPAVLDVAFTAGLEESLDKIEEGEADLQTTLQQFYDPFKATVNTAQAAMRNIKRMEEVTDIACEKCGAHMVIKWGKNGSFLGCSAYPACSNTKAFHREDGKIVIEAQKETDQKCNDCGAAMVVKRGRFGDFLGCSRYPECSFTMPMPTGIKCPKPDCGGDVVNKRSKRGKTFYGCSKYPGCDFVSWLKPINTSCTKCGNPYLVEKVTRHESSIQCPECGNKAAEK